MIAFRYDKTFEGLLTAVFDAYSRKTFPERLLSESEWAPMFAEDLHLVVTESYKSARVWAALEKKLSVSACGMLVHVWLSELPGSDELLFRYLCKTFDSASPVAGNFADKDVLEVVQIARKVSKERERLMQFARFRKTADDIFFAPVSPLYNALPLALPYFTDRFARQKWLVYDLKRKYGYYYDLLSVAEVSMERYERFPDGKLDESVQAQDEALFQNLWKEYTSSLTIKERLNPRLQRRHMPRRFWKYMPEKS